MYLNYKPQSWEMEFAGRTLKVETGKLAQQCNGSVVVTYGNTSILATATMSREPRKGIDFVPLVVNYMPKFYAAGKIKSSRFNKREGRPADEQILIQRLIDRGIRPLMPKGYTFDTQIMCTVLSYDNVEEHDIVSAVAAGIAMSISDIPFQGPIATVRVGQIDGQFLINPSFEQKKESVLDLVVTTGKEDIVMIEAGANQVNEDIMYDAIMKGKQEAQKLVTFIETVVVEVGKEKKVSEAETLPESIRTQVESVSRDSFWKALAVPGKVERYTEILKIKKETVDTVLETLSEEDKAYEPLMYHAADKVWKSIVRENILVKKQRIHGRKLDEIRPILTEVDTVPHTHGSGLFTRGETQCLSVVTVGSPGDAQTIDNLEPEWKKRYMHHYNFPPYSVGEVNARLFTGNREVGHGALAERALEPVLPSKEDFPYTLRVVSEILSSNGSSSMAATCGSTLSLMAAGVPIAAPVSGIAMGLMIGDDGQYEILTDLQDEEDFGGDMDFKVAGTPEGITAIQMDIKVQGLSDNIFREALDRAYTGRIQVMDSMKEAIVSPRREMSPLAPRITSFKIDPDMIRVVIGKGGETIQKIIEETGVTIDIEDDGLVIITSTDGEGAKAATAQIEVLTYQPKVGDVLSGPVTRVSDFGAFVQIVPGKDGLLHISEIAHERTNNVSDVLTVGDQVEYKVIEIKGDKVSLSRKALIEKPQKEEGVPQKEEKKESKHFEKKSKFSIKKPAEGEIETTQAEEKAQGEYSDKRESHPTQPPKSTFDASDTIKELKDF